jgi:hypothetical protein
LGRHPTSSFPDIFTSTTLTVSASDLLSRRSSRRLQRQVPAMTAAPAVQATVQPQVTPTQVPLVVPVVAPTTVPTFLHLLVRPEYVIEQNLCLYLMILPAVDWPPT